MNHTTFGAVCASLHGEVMMRFAHVCSVSAVLNFIKRHVAQYEPVRYQSITINRIVVLFTVCHSAYRRSKLQDDVEKS